MFTKETNKEVFAKGGRTTFAKYGKDYMSLIGKKGGRPDFAKRLKRELEKQGVDKPTIAKEKRV